MQITEIYLSIQGETSLSGLPTIFIRLAGCHLRCTWCDTPHSFPSGDKMSIDQVMSITASINCPRVCITGGEPLLQKNVFPLIQTLLDANYSVSIETSGTLPIREIDPRAITILDIKCPASGVSDRNYFENLTELRPHDEVKFVIQDETDYLFAKEVCKNYNLFQREPLPLFSPVHGVLPPHRLIEWVLKEHLPVRINLQIHKYIWSPTKIGV